ncbi:MAG: nuclease [Acidobacteriota bacterium]|nr:nuclease [Acidobacteriota bacterium]
MSAIILLDSGPLSLLSMPHKPPLAVACQQWFEKLAGQGTEFAVPEITDYELRRELLRAGKSNGIAELESLIKRTTYLPISTQAMRQAAMFWAQARQQGQPTAGDKNLDADMILCAQAMTLGTPDFIVATTNLRHLRRFVPAALWQNIS